MLLPLRLAVFSSSDFIIPMIKSIQTASGKRLLDLLSADFIHNHSCHSHEEFLRPIQLDCIVSQPDTLNRSKIVQNPVAAFARQNNIFLFTPAKINTQYQEQLPILSKLDMVITASFGQIISPKILSLPRFGIINWHPSKLPKYRGATPMQSAIADGQTATALSWIEMEKGMDSGAVLSSFACQIQPNHTIIDLISAMSNFGVQTWAEAVALQILHRKKLFLPEIQNESEVTFCGQLSKSDALINPTILTASQIFNHWRAYALFPGTSFVSSHFGTVKIIQAQSPLTTIPPDSTTQFEDEQWLQIKHQKSVQTFVKCSNKTYLPISIIQLENGKKLHLQGYQFVR